MIRMHRIAGAAGLAAALVSGSALAQVLAQAQRPAAQAAAAGNQAALLESAGAWGAYASQQGPAGKICYALSQPKDRLPKGLNRDPAYLYVSIRPRERVKGEISFVLGFPVKSTRVPNTNPPVINYEPGEATIAQRTFALVTKGDKAWLRNPAEEAAFIAALREGADLSVKLTSARGNALTDVYSLSGFSKSWDRTQKECP